jgi:hypothetical protein
VERCASRCSEPFNNSTSLLQDVILQAPSQVGTAEISPRNLAERERTFNDRNEQVERNKAFLYGRAVFAAQNVGVRSEGPILVHKWSEVEFSKDQIETAIVD